MHSTYLLYKCTINISSDNVVPLHWLNSDYIFREEKSSNNINNNNEFYANRNFPPLNSIKQDMLTRKIIEMVRSYGLISFDIGWHERLKINYKKSDSSNKLQKTWSIQ